MKQHFSFFSIVLFIVLVLDILAKFLVRYGLRANQSIQVIDGFISLTRVHNTGAFWGLLQDNNTMFIIISLLVISLLIYCFKDLTHTKTSSFFAALLFGGAIGNIIDRVLLGFVIDFIDFRFWPVFNIADAAITVGIIGIVFLNLKGKNTKKR